MKRLLTTLVLGPCFSLLASAQPASTYLSGQDLLNKMNGTHGQQMQALGYVAGVADSRSGVAICIPPGRVSVGQLHDMVKDVLERVPSERHQPADIYVEAALSDRWPCDKKRGGKSL